MNEPARQRDEEAYASEDYLRAMMRKRERKGREERDENSRELFGREGYDAAIGA